jgi:hypothetical protein
MLARGTKTERFPHRGLMAASLSRGLGAPFVSFYDQTELISLAIETQSH